MRIRLAKNEFLLAALGAALALVALGGPHLAQPAHYHGFADQRTLWGVPCALDVLSNMAFALAGLVGLAFAARARHGALTPMQRAMAALFFTGLVVTAAGSAWYHLAPDHDGLLVDRLAMAIAFAGILGLLAATQASERAGAATGLVLLAAAPAAALWWHATGNLLPWAAVQVGGLLALLALGWGKPRAAALPFTWGGVLAAYAVAKLLESNDHAVFDLTNGWISGHSLKHIVAAGAALPIIASLKRAASRQNADASRPTLVPASEAR